MENLMPHLTKLPPISEDAFLDDLMESLGARLPLLERDESVRLLKALHNTLNQEIVWAEALAERQSVLLHEIPGTSSSPVLLEIHTQLNALETEHFLKIESVPALHKSCTEYRDLLVHRALKLVEEELAEAGKGVPP